VLFKKGLSIRQISKELKIGVMRVKRMMRLMNLYRNKSESEKLKWKTQNIKKKRLHTKRSIFFAGKNLYDKGINPENQIEFTKLTGIPYRILYNHFGSWNHYKSLIY
jgi:hypothetical protein